MRQIVTWELKMTRQLRKFNAWWLAPVMRITGFRFSKDYRWEMTLYHTVVYHLVDTVGANVRADRIGGAS